MQSDTHIFQKHLSIILRTIVYYDIFDYSVHFKDISIACVFSENDKTLCQNALDYLVQKKVIFKIFDYYALKADPLLVEKRLKGEAEAKGWMKKAKQYSRIISYFPYVRGVSLSGSLSKGIIGDDPDIDYFIITEPNRLWLTRALLTAFKKIFLLNSYRYFCINYFIDSKNLEIEEKNIFTATEIATLVPVYGHTQNKKFFEQNAWVKNYYPPYFTNERTTLLKHKDIVFKNFLELLLKNKIGDRLDDFFMNITKRFWKTKFGNKYSKEEFELLFKSKKHISKHHPQNFQHKVLKQYAEKIEEISEKYNIVIEEIKS